MRLRLVLAIALGVGCAPKLVAPDAGSDVPVLQPDVVDLTVTNDPAGDITADIIAPAGGEPETRDDRTRAPDVEDPKDQVKPPPKKGPKDGPAPHGGGDAPLPHGDPRL